MSRHTCHACEGTPVFVFWECILHWGLCFLKGHSIRSRHESLPKGTTIQPIEPCPESVGSAPGGDRAKTDRPPPHPTDSVRPGSQHAEPGELSPEIVDGMSVTLPRPLPEPTPPTGPPQIPELHFLLITNIYCRVKGVIDPAWWPWELLIQKKTTAQQ